MNARMHIFDFKGKQNILVYFLYNCEFHRLEYSVCLKVKKNIAKIMD